MGAMDILQTVRADLQGATLVRQREVAVAIGIPWSTLRKIVDGATNNPRYDTVEQLRTYYARRKVAPRPDQGTEVAA